MMPVDSDPKIPHGEGYTAWVEVGSALLSLALEALTVSAPQSLSNNVGWEWESAMPARVNCASMRPRCLLNTFSGWCVW